MRTPNLIGGSHSMLFICPGPWTQPESVSGRTSDKMAL
jgi:hypothetical protein